MTDSLKKLLSGDEKAFEEFIKENQAKVYRVALSMVRNPQDAEDIAQETFVKVYMSLSSFAGRSEITTWVYRIAYNLSIDFLKKHGKRAKITKTLDDPDDTELLELSDDSFLPEDAFEKKEVKKDIYDALQSLPDEQRELIELKDIHGFSYEEIAEMLSIKEGTLKSRLNRGRLALKKILLKKWNIDE
ncbi:MAG: sigma-70 family RNA polymerase sigma factor [Clostridia bacterium]|jgi:RNA polymerase sigma-70 factor (ECF subfamily)|nr:sigma-70 family RNA polymerase sigma factor [Clostridia bacterium]MBQ6171572.1 sigma-70 family RNA polymerase sigma factor [Clostridia bacterium]